MKKLLISIACLLIFLSGSNTESVLAVSKITNATETEIGQSTSENEQKKNIKEEQAESVKDESKKEAASNEEGVPDQQKKEKEAEIEQSTSENEQKKNTTEEQTKLKENHPNGGVVGAEERVQDTEEIVGDKWTISSPNSSELLIELRDNPDPYYVQQKISYMISLNMLDINNKSKLTIRGTFGPLSKPHGLTWPKKLKEVRFENSNYVPKHFFKSAEISKYSDDGSVTEIQQTAFNLFGDSSLESFDSPNLQIISRNSLGKVKMEHFFQKELRKIKYETFDSLHGNESIKSIELPKLEEIEGSDTTFIERMKNLESVYVPLLKEVGNFLIMSPNVKEVNALSLEAVNETLLYLNQFKETMKFDFPSLKKAGSIGIGSSPLLVKVSREMEMNAPELGAKTFIYSSVTPQVSYVSQIGDSLEINAFGKEDKWKAGRGITIGWKKNGELLPDTGENLHIPSIQEDGTYIYQPVLLVGGKELDKNIFPEIQVVVGKQTLTAEAEPQDVSLGGEISSQHAQKMVKNVRVGDKLLQPDEYEVEVISQPDTNLIGNKKTKVQVKTKDNKIESKILEVPTQVVWGETINLLGSYSSNVMGLTLHTQLDGTIKMTSSRGGSKGSGSRIHPEYKSEYIGADLFSVSNRISGRDNLERYYNFSITGQEKNDNAYKNFKPQIVKSGDVIQIRHKQMLSYPDLATLHHENKSTHIGKGRINNVAFFEITSSGYKQLYFNQLTPRKVTVKNGATKEELNQKLQESIDLKGHKDITIDRFKDKLPNTTKDGEQKIDVVVSETLQSGKKVEYTYMVPFVVNPVVKEQIYSSDGTLLDTKQTELQYGKDSFSPDPKDQLEVDGVKYQYDGWLSGQQKPGEGSPQKGKPKPVKETTTFHYIYSDVNNMIHVTIPTEMIFSSSDTVKKEIQSNRYRIENHADEAKLNIKLASFETKESAGIQLLTPSEPDPIQGTEAMRLHVFVNGLKKINSLNETSKMLEIGTMNPKEIWTMQFGGTYFGEITKEKKKTDHAMILKFSVNS
ncbi:hypothetical protein ACUXG3_006124 [Bacillus thuringiensis]